MGWFTAEAGNVDSPAKIPRNKMERITVEVCLTRARCGFIERIS
jgi:hypothetical protein